MNQNEQDQISKVMAQEQEAKRLAAAYLSGQMSLEEYGPLAREVGPHIDLRALGDFWHQRGQEEKWDKFIGTIKSAGQSVLNFFSNLHPN